MLAILIITRSATLWLTLAATISTVQSQTLTIYPPVPSESESNTTHLYFGLMMSFGGTLKSSGVIPGVQIALDLVNNNQTVLKGYTLHYILYDSQVIRASGSLSSLSSHPGRD